MRLEIDPFQYTLKEPVSCCGIGLHSGRTVNLKIKPASADTGIRFFRTDQSPDTPLPARTEQVVDTQLATTLGNEHFKVSTTEHLLAAFQGAGIDNADIEIDSTEVPIMDGSAEPFYKMLRYSGKKRQGRLKRLLCITHPVLFSDGDAHISISPYPGFKITGEIQFDDTVIKEQKFCFELSDTNFASEIARARTFGYVEQVEELWANGLALGGSLANVIAIHWNRKSVLNEDGLRYKNEFIRHKVLDLLGDFALLGCPVLGHVVAFKAGHTQHLGLMKELLNAPDCWQLIDLNHAAHDCEDNEIFSAAGCSTPIANLYQKNMVVSLS